MLCECASKTYLLTKGHAGLLGGGGGPGTHPKINYKTLMKPLMYQANISFENKQDPFVGIVN